MQATARFGIGRRWYLAVTLVVALIAAASLLAGCTQLGISGELDPPEAAVDSLLQLRVAHSTDATAYAEYVSAEMAAALATPQSEEASGALVPEWESPYLSVDGTTTAEVIVVWVDPVAFDAKWPAATIFKMEFIEEKWLAVDAQPIADKAFVPDPK